MRCVQTLAQHPVRASQRLSSAPQAVQKAVSVMMASYSMDIHVFKRLSVAAMTMEELTRYSSTPMSVQKKHSIAFNVQMISLLIIYHNTHKNIHADMAIKLPVVDISQSGLRDVH